MKKYISSLMLLLAAMIWGFAFSAQKAAESVPPFTIGALRSIIAGIFLLILIPAMDKLRHTGRHLFSKKRILDFNKTELIGGAICGTVLAVATFFQQLGMALGADAGKTSFITALYVVLVPIYALALKKRAPVNVWISIVIAAVGFYFLCISGDFTIEAPDLIVCVCSLIFPIQILAIDHFSPKCDGVRMSCIQFFAGAIVNALLAIITEMPVNFANVWQNILPIFFLGIMSSGVAYTLQILGQRGANPAAASIIMSLESVFGVIGAALLLGERMSTREYIGAAIVFVAVILSQLDVSAIRKTLKDKKNANIS